MNKYQETLDFVKSLHLNDNQQETNFRVLEDIVQELIDKANKYDEKETPIKLIEDDSEYDKYGECDFLCPNCKKLLGSETYDECLDYKYCPKCGQRLEKRLENIKENKEQIMQKICRNTLIV